MLSTKLVAPVFALALCSTPATSQNLPATMFSASETIVLASAPGDDLSSSSSQPPPLPLSMPKTSFDEQKKFHVHLFSHIAGGVKIGMFGAGAEVATPLSRAFNLRAGVNFAQFNQAFRLDGIHYSTGVNYRSAQINVDWFPFHGGFHISPGVLYFRQGLAGTADVPPGQSFTLDDVHYINTVDDPVNGTASLEYKSHYAPMILFGFSNIIPRNGKHISVPFEFGLAYTHAPVIDVQLHGTACTYQGCFNAATDTATQKNLTDQVHDVQVQIDDYPVYPIVSLGFAYRF